MPMLAAAPSDLAIPPLPDHLRRRPRLTLPPGVRITLRHRPSRGRMRRGMRWFGLFGLGCGALLVMAGV